MAAPHDVGHAIDQQADPLAARVDDYVARLPRAFGLAQPEDDAEVQYGHDFTAQAHHAADRFRCGRARA